MGSSEAAGACGGKKKAASPLFISRLPPPPHPVDTSSATVCVSRSVPPPPPSVSTGSDGRNCQHGPTAVSAWGRRRLCRPSAAFLADHNPLRLWVDVVTSPLGRHCLHLRRSLRTPRRDPHHVRVPFCMFMLISHHLNREILIMPVFHFAGLPRRPVGTVWSVRPPLCMLVCFGQIS
jgi:hypothetical protein